MSSLPARYLSQKKTIVEVLQDCILFLQLELIVSVNSLYSGLVEPNTYLHNRQFECYKEN